MAGRNDSRRRVLVAALMLAALSAGTGFVVVSGRWQPAPTPTPMVDTQAAFAGPRSAPCGSADDAAPCAPLAPGGALAGTLATTAAASGMAADDAIGVDSVAHDNVARLASADTTGTVLNQVQPDVLVAKESGGSGSLHPGGGGVASGGAAAGASGPGTRGSNPDRAVGAVSSTGNSEASSASMPPGVSGEVTGTSTASSQVSSGTAAAPVVVAPAVPPVFVEHKTTVSELIKGRSDTGTPINIMVGGGGEPMSSTPEPSSMLLIGTGVVGLGAFLKRRRAAAGTTRKD